MSGRGVHTVHRLSKREFSLNLCIPEFAGSNPTEAVEFFSDVKKSSACLPSEGK
jgi:hypothetical protein